MIKDSVLIVILLCVLTAGCTTTQKQYYFGDYSNTLYDFEKDKSEETLAEHKEQLEHIVSESKEKSIHVPPGIYAELGYIYLKENKPKEAIAFFKKESVLYPESKQFMDRLIQRSCNEKI